MSKNPGPDIESPQPLKKRRIGSKGGGPITSVTAAAILGKDMIQRPPLASAPHPERGLFSLSDMISSGDDKMKKIIDLMGRIKVHEKFKKEDLMQDVQRCLKSYFAIKHEKTADYKVAEKSDEDIKKGVTDFLSSNSAFKKKDEKNKGELTNLLTKILKNGASAINEAMGSNQEDLLKDLFLIINDRKINKFINFDNKITTAELLKFFINSKFSLKYEFFTCDIFSDSISNGRTALLQKLIDDNPEYLKNQDKLIKLIHQAVYRNNTMPVLMLLLAGGENISEIINKQDKDGNTALHKIKYQLEHKKKDAQVQGVIVNLLLAFGADPTIKNKQNLLPLQDDKYKEGFNAIKEFLEMEGCEVDGAKGGSEIFSAKIQNPLGTKKTKQDSQELGEVDLDTIDSGGLCEFKEDIFPPVEGKGDIATEVSISVKTPATWADMIQLPPLASAPHDGCMLPSSSSLTQTEEDKDWELELELFGATNYLDQTYGSISFQERSQESSQKLKPYEIGEFVPVKKSDESMVVSDAVFSDLPDESPQPLKKRRIGSEGGGPATSFTTVATLSEDMIQLPPLASAPQPEILASSSQKEILTQDKKLIMERIRQHTIHENFPQNKKETLYEDIENWIGLIERDRKSVDIEKFDDATLNHWTLNFLLLKPSFHNISDEEKQQQQSLFIKILREGKTAINRALDSYPENNLVKNLFLIISTRDNRSLKKPPGIADLPKIEVPKIYKYFIDSDLSFKGFTDKFDYAIKNNRTELLQKLIDHNPEHIKGERFTKLLDIALTRNSPNIVLKILLALVDDDIREILNKQDNDGNTALHKIKSQLEHKKKDAQAQGIIVNLLLAFGADPKIKNKQNLLPLQDDKYKEGFNAIKEFLEIEGCEVDGAKGGSEIFSAKIQNPRGRKKTKQDSRGSVEADPEIDSSLRGGLCEFKEVIFPVEEEGHIAKEVSIIGQSVNNAEPGDGCMLPSSSSLTQTEEDNLPSIDWEIGQGLFENFYQGQAYRSKSYQERSQKLKPYEIGEFVPVKKSNESMVVSDEVSVTTAEESFLVPMDQEYQKEQEWGQEQEQGYSAPRENKNIAELLSLAMEPRTDEPISFFGQPTQAAPHPSNQHSSSEIEGSSALIAMHEQYDLSEVIERRSTPEGERVKIAEASRMLTNATHKSKSTS